MVVGEVPRRAAMLLRLPARRGHQLQLLLQAHRPGLPTVVAADAVDAVAAALRAVEAAADVVAAVVEAAADVVVLVDEAAGRTAVDADLITDNTPASATGGVLRLPCPGRSRSRCAIRR